MTPFMLSASLYFMMLGQPHVEHPGTAPAQNLSATLQDHRVAIAVENQVFTEYRFDPAQKYPYFWPVNGPLTNQSITTESSAPYPHHHSLFFACDRVNGLNFWQEENDRGQIVSVGVKLVQDKGPIVVFTDTCLWQAPGQAPVIRDLRRLAVSAPSETVRYIDFDITLEPLTDVVVEKSNHALFAARVVPALSADKGGVLVNSRGDSGEKGTWGVPAPWCDYSGTRDGITEGVAIFQHPQNRWFPAPWFTRDYGFFSPTPMYWLENGRLDLPKGQLLRLRYRVMAHEGDHKTADVAGHFARYVKHAGSR